MFLLGTNTIFTDQLIRAINYNDIDLIIDVGANDGQFGFELIRSGYKGKIISIEPLKEAYRVLKNNSRNYPSWTIFPQMALGARNGSTFINVSQNSVSSSLLDILPAHLKAASNSKYIRKEKIKIYKLDSFINKFRKYKNILIKIDSQGYESYILDGAKKILKSDNLRGLLIEVSFVKLYMNQKDFLYFYRKLTELKFSIWGTEQVFVDRKQGRAFQANLLAFKPME